MAIIKKLLAVLCFAALFGQAAGQGADAAPRWNILFLDTGVPIPH